jgi:hypothetical protein
MNNLPDKIINIHPPTVIYSGGKKWAVFSTAGWFQVDDSFTLQDAYSRWVRWAPNESKQAQSNFKIASKRSGEIYNVSFNGGNWRCECSGFLYRRNCRHVKLAKQSLKNEKKN